MTISNNSINLKSVNRPESVHGSDKGAAQAAKSTEMVKSKDVANVSEQAMLLSKSRAALNEIPDVRSDIVQNLKKSISEDTYKVPIEKLASMLLNRLHIT